MERGRRRKRIRCAGSAGEGGWFSASGGNDGRELPCRLGDLQGQIKMVWDRNSPTQERTELSVSSPWVCLFVFCRDFPWLYTETSEGFHSFLQRITIPVVWSVRKKSPRKSWAPHQDVNQVRKGYCQPWTSGCQMSEFRAEQHDPGCNRWVPT